MGFGGRLKLPIFLFDMPDLSDYIEANNQTGGIMKYQVGQRFSFKQKYLVDRYGKEAWIISTEECFTGSHPGHVYKNLFDLDTSNGTVLRGWDSSMIRSNMKPAA